MTAAYLVLAYLAASFWEATFHRKALHEPSASGRMLRYLREYHLLHHADTAKNFNLLLGADWLLGRSKG